MRFVRLSVVITFVFCALSLSHAQEEQYRGICLTLAAASRFLRETWASSLMMVGILLSAAA